MSDNANKKPSHNVYTVRAGSENGSDYWTKVGVAFAHNDKKGFSVVLDSLPIDGKLTIRIADSKKK